MISQQSESHEEHEVRERAKRWIARFAPLLDKVDTLELAELHQKLTMLQQLREEGATLLPLLPTLWNFDDFEIVDAVNSASQQIPSIESELRRQLSLVSPGDPLGEVNLEALQEKLSEREARQELGLDISQPVPFVLEEVFRLLTHRLVLPLDFLDSDGLCLPPFIAS